MKFTLLSLAGLFAVSMVAKLASGDDKNDSGVKPQDLIGLYEIVSGEHSGEVIPPERIKGHTVRFTEGKIVSADHENKERFSCTYKLDSTKSPAAIHMVSTVKGHEGQPAAGLIMQAGDEVRLIYSLPECLDAPKKFKTEAGQQMFVLKKVKG